MTFHEACEFVLTQCPYQYAKAYAAAGLRLPADGEAARVQALYILSNMRSWRGEDARQVRIALRACK